MSFLGDLPPPMKWQVSFGSPSKATKTGGPSKKDRTPNPFIPESAANQRIPLILHCKNPRSKGQVLSRFNGFQPARPPPPCPCRGGIKRTRRTPPPRLGEPTLAGRPFFFFGGGGVPASHLQKIYALNHGLVTERTKPIFPNPEQSLTLSTHGT